MRGAIVVLSGGQDSTTCLAWAQRQGFNVVAAVFFDYGQKHLKAEWDSACAIAGRFNVGLTRLSVPALSQLGDSALTDHSQAVLDSARAGLPSTFTPGRNMLFLSLAAALGYKFSYDPISVITGICQTDYSGYPDCREGFAVAWASAMSRALDRRVEIHTPLMYLTKAETVRMMQDFGQLEAYALTHTCYHGIRPGCGQCPACNLRAKGFAEAGVPDPLFAVATP